MMNDNIFKNLKEKVAPNGLAARIFVEIERRQARSARVRFAIFLSVLTASVAFFIPVITMLWNDLVSSGSTNFFSMLFTDFSAVVASGWDFVLSFFENLPIFSVTIFLFVIFTILLSLYFVQKDLKKVFHNSYSLKI